MAFALPELGYAYDALEPHIDARTMEIHHTKHHATYTTNLNAALEGHADLQGMSAEALVADLDSLPEGIRTAVRNNGGGFVNHNLFWTVIAPGGNSEDMASDALKAAVDAAFGDYKTFVAQFSAAAATRFGSGWAWLIAAGGLLPATGGTLIRLGEPSFKYLAELGGVILIFAGFLLATRQTPRAP